MPSQQRVFKAMCSSAWPKLLTGVCTVNMVAARFNINPNRSSTKLVLYNAK